VKEDRQGSFNIARVFSIDHIVRLQEQIDELHSQVAREFI